MTDVNGTVTGIQGNPVESQSLSSNEDGYVLTWVNADSEWEAKPSVSLQSQVFTSSGTFTVPEDIRNKNEF